MDDHIRLVEVLFSAARSEFKHLEHFYFHNCVYKSVWIIPPLCGALLKNEQDVHLLERLAFIARRDGAPGQP